uniref:F-box domain-containing protein n=1 Tax=Globodera rostochiensis TaxID=31243 RepID=A0A914GSQ0_GLORO
MSDNESDEEQQQQMEEVSICADVWLEIFAFVSPLQLGHLMALISDRFDVLVDEHFKLRKWSLSWLQIRRATDGNSAQFVNRSGKQLPIPQGPLPSKVIGFERIWIRYIDQPVIEFLQRIRRLFNSCGTNVWITTSDDQSRSWEIIWQKICPFVNNNCCRFLLFRPSQLDNLRQFSPTVLRNCANLRMIDSVELFPAFPAEDNAGASSGQAMAKWLLTAREDGRPKMLCCRFYSEGMEELKWAFVNAIDPANFFIRFWFYGEDDNFVPFELKNNLTGERLTLRKMDEVNWMLVRCPIAREEAKWAEWEEETIQWKWIWWTRQRNRIVIDFKDSDIGDRKVKAKTGRMCLIA